MKNDVTYFMAELILTICGLLIIAMVKYRSQNPSLNNNVIIRLSLLIGLDKLLTIHAFYLPVVFTQFILQNVNSMQTQKMALKAIF